jgi:stage III sporulation protein AH
MAVIVWRRKREMQPKWKRNAVVGTMAVLVCAAAALNWKYSAGVPVEETDKILGEAELVSGQEDVEETGLAMDENTVYTGSDYFSSARLTRQQARDNAIALLREAAAQEDADETVANEASEGIQVLASYTLKEAQIENLVTAKGYVDCVAFMGDTSVSVVVSTENGELTAEDVAKITDIAMTETGLSAAAIKIMEAN